MPAPSWGSLATNRGQMLGMIRLIGIGSSNERMIRQAGGQLAHKVPWLSLLESRDVRHENWNDVSTRVMQCSSMDTVYASAMPCDDGIVKHMHPWTPLRCSDERRAAVVIQMSIFSHRSHRHDLFQLRPEKASLKNGIQTAILDA